MPIPSLEQTQRLLWTLLTAPEGAALGLAHLAPADRAAADSLVRGDVRLSAIERLEIYADMYFYRIRDCLKEDFAALSAVIGETRFHNLITDYLVVHPPSHFSLRYAGQHLPAFVGAHPLSAPWPYLGDLAALEWSVLEAFDAPDAIPLETTALAAVSAARWPALRLQPTPSLQVLQSAWAVHTVWERTQRGEPPGEPQREPTALRVWRQDLRVLHRVIDQAEVVALTALADGATFADVCERIVDCDGESHAAERAVEFVRDWLADHLLVGFSVAE